MEGLWIFLFIVWLPQDRSCAEIEIKNTMDHTDTSVMTIEQLLSDSRDMKQKLSHLTQEVEKLKAGKHIQNTCTNQHYQI